MIDLLLIWVTLLLALLLFGIGKRGSGGALTLAYFLGLSLIHVPGILPSFGAEWDDVESTRIGFETTLVGMTSFVVGALIARLVLVGRADWILMRPDNSNLFRRLGWRAVVVGGVAYLVLLP